MKKIFLLMITMIVIFLGVNSVSATYSHECAFTTGGELKCWGENDNGQTNIPTGYNFKKINVGGLHTCGITMNDELKCWGDNTYGQINVPGGYKWNKVSGDLFHTCGITMNDELKCWGGNVDGQINVPSGYKWIDVGSAGIVTCGITTSNELKCWGRNGYGQLSIPNGYKWKKVESGYFNICGITTADELKCWGYNGYGQLEIVNSGLGKKIEVGFYHICKINNDDSLECYGYNLNALEGYKWKDVSVGWLHICGLLDNNKIICWGDYRYGQRNIPEGYSWKSFTENIEIQQPIQIPTPTNLNQYIIPATLQEREEIQVGSKIGKFQSGSGVIFETEIDNPESKELKIEVELYEKLYLTTRTLKSGIINSSGKKIFTIPLEAGDYTWKLRLEDTDGNTSDWVEFENNGTDIDFSIFEGFEPYPYGFKFNNPGISKLLLDGGTGTGTLGERYIIPGTRWDIFNNATYDNIFENDTQKINVFENIGMNDKDKNFAGGNCFGMSLAGAFSFSDKAYLNSHYNNFSEKVGTGTIWENIEPLETNFITGKWNEYDDTLETILSLQLLQYSSSFTEAEQLSYENLKPLDILDTMKLNSGYTYILTFRGKKGGVDVAHAVVPYKAEGNKVYVWDNNFPYPVLDELFKNKQYIEINSNIDWFSPLYRDRYNWDSFDRISLVKLSDIDFSRLGLPGGFNKTDVMYTVSGSIDIIIKDELGNKTGFINGVSIEEIPGTRIIVPYNASVSGELEENTWKQIYLPQKLENLTIEINGKTDENYDLMIAGGDYYTKLEGITTSSGQTDTFNISRENIKIDLDDNKTGSYNILVDDFQNNSTGSIYLHQLETIKEKQELNIDWNKVINNENDSINYSIDLDNDGIYDIESNFNSLPKIENETGSISGYLKGINSTGNSNMAGWKIYIDSNNDGKLQENKENFVITDNKGYYEFKDLEKGDYSIKIIMKPNWEQIKQNNNYYDINLNNGQNIVNLSFENKFLKGNNKK